VSCSASRPEHLTGNKSLQRYQLHHTPLILAWLNERDYLPVITKPQALACVPEGVGSAFGPCTNENIQSRLKRDQFACTGVKLRVSP
jgi:hypothetical protein